ncbi:DNA gyrase subunit A [Candidatus Sulfotelmatobacter kueseliae]|uniref:DNA gyrase subunit A n=1 Tax=Candidatus Sulfotelmatobacter kueseliae TaxID=2042962 RepID=A0A2U3LBZ8_9BACT|nr:DNA gyrase subunit A [Candidatus Sulfotelmatobacter kueseliae]
MADDQNPELPLTPPPGSEGPGALNIQPVNIEEEMRRSYLDYAMSVIIGRALPDVRDGLKPVHRRILYTMQQMGLLPNRATRKCARIVGEVMGKYHPHGNLAVYDALVRLAQDWSMRYPLIFGQGNFGSIDGDPPAADRYTEAKLAQVATPLLEDLDKETVDFHPNYDGSEVEPDVLPARIPNLLINGSDGIAVGMATKIPPHNLTEIVDATITLINNPNAQLADILKFVLGPDFPTAGVIHGRAGIFEAYRTGRGRFMMRASAAIENITKERQAIIVTEIPYQVNKAKLVERIAQLVNDKDIEDISDIRDESDRDGMRVVVELKRGAEPQIVLNQLFKHTQMQESFSMILLAVVNGQPREMGLIQAIKYFIEHRVDVVRRRTAYLLAKAKDREHILEGYITALDHLDNVIAIIRGSANRADARENLVLYFGGKKIDINTTGRAPKLDPEKPFTAKQADAILELQLHRLTRLSIDEIAKELKDVRENIAEYESILASEKKLRGVIIKELEEVKKLYGDERRTRIEDEAAEIVLEDLIADEQVAVTVSHSGYLKRTPISTYRMQRRGGQGRTGMKTRDEDFVEHLFLASTHAYILILTNNGRVYWLKVYEIPDVSAAGKGKHISNLVGLQPGETVKTVVAVRNLEEENKYIFFATRNGLVKKSELREFMHVRSNGINAINIEKDDELVAARVTDGNQIIFLASHEGMAVRFDESHVRPMGRAAYGVWGIDLEEKDYLVGMATTTKPSAGTGGVGADSPAPAATGDQQAGASAPEAAEPTDEAVKGSLILSVTENGFGKRTPADSYRLTNRGGKGVINVKTTERVGKVVGIAQVDETSQVMLISHYGKIIRMDSTTIRESGRVAQGVRLLQMEPGDRVAAAVVIAPEEETNGGNGTLIQ